MGCAGSKTADKYDDSDEHSSGRVVESIKESVSSAIALITDHKPVESGHAGGRVRTMSASNRADRAKVLEQMRREQEHFTMESVEQFQFLMSLPLEDREKWSKVFQKVDASNDGLVSQDEVFDAMDMEEEGKIQRAFMNHLFSYFNDYHHEGKNLNTVDLNEPAFFIGIFNFCTMPRGDYMTRFVFQLYGGNAEGMSPAQFKIMCDDVMQPGTKSIMEDLDESRMIRLLNHFIKEEREGGGEKEKSPRGRRSSSSHHHSGHHHSHSSHSSHSSHKHHHHKHHHGKHKHGKSPKSSPMNSEEENDESGREVAEVAEVEDQEEDKESLITLMRAGSDERVIKFKFFVKAERKLSGEGVYHAAVTLQDAFRSHFLGAPYWADHLDRFLEIVYSRDLWNMADVFSFAVCGTKMPENYHDVNYEEAEAVRQREKDKKKKDKERKKEAISVHLLQEEHKAKKENCSRRPSVEVRQRSRSEHHYAGNDSQGEFVARSEGEGAEGGMSRQHTGAFLGQTHAEGRRGLGPGGLNPYVVLQDMPACMRMAFEDQDVDMLKSIAHGYVKEVDIELFWRKMHQAEDAGLWEGNSKTLAE